METGELERGTAEEVSPSKKRLNVVLFFILFCCAIRFFIPNRTGDVHSGLELESEGLNRFTNRMSLRVYLCPEETRMDEFPLPADRDVVFKSHQLNVRPRRGLKQKEEEKAIFLKKNIPGICDYNSKNFLDDVENFWKPTLSLNIINIYKPYHTHVVQNETLHDYSGYMEFHTPSGDYYPIIFPNEFSLSKRDLIPLNDTTLLQVPLTLSWNTMGLLKFNTIYLLLNGKVKQNIEDYDGTNTIMETFLSHPFVLTVYKAWVTNPFGVAAPIFIIVLVHVILDFFALKNDINFWRNNKNPSGLSVNSICVNCIYELIIILHLLDMGTPWIVLLGNIAFLIAEIWKIVKSVTISVQWCHPSIPLPYISFKYLDSYKHSVSREYDEIAHMHQIFVVTPLLLGYTAFSFLYMDHKNWQSWILHSLVSFVYIFGFINMTPQLYINYRLKSVAHLPWRAMAYKSLSTFIDDVFAFVIDMPILYRLACFRDDFIFLVYIYQRYIYRTDFTRTNEYGQLPLPLPLPPSEQKECIVRRLYYREVTLTFNEI